MHSRQQLADCAETLIFLRLHRIEEIVKQRSLHSFDCSPNCLNRDLLLDPSRQLAISRSNHVDYGVKIFSYRVNNRLNNQLTRLPWYVFFFFSISKELFRNVSDDYIKNSFFSQPLFFCTAAFLIKPVERSIFRNFEKLLWKLIWNEILLTSNNVRESNSTFRV